MKTSQKGFITPWLIALVAILLIGGGVYLYVHNKQSNQPMAVNPTTQATSTAQATNSQTADWKTYQNQQLGLSIKYPQQYAVEENTTTSISDAEWTQMDLFTIYDPTKPSDKAGFPTVLNATLERQSSIFPAGKIYHTIDDFISGYYGSKSSAYEFISTNGGIRMAYDLSLSEYVFMKNDLIYDLYASSTDPYLNEIIQSISFK